jgi:beta-phosphoglucomutase-like phosphatase (HAD superfamily)
MLHPSARALIFDIDGTLVDTMPLHFVAWMRAANKHGFPFDEPTFYSLAGMPALEIIELVAARNGLDIDPRAVAADKEAGFIEQIERALPIAEVVAVVRQCHGRLPMALGTGGTREVAWKTITAAGLKPYFDILVSSEDVIRHKPAPDTFLECARRMGVAAGDCQVFEDADKGIEAAINAGMIPCDIRQFVRRRP